MHLSLRHGVSRLIPVLAVAALLAVCFGSASFAAGARTSTGPKLGGTWKGRYSGAYSGTFTIQWRQTTSGRLRGSIRLSNPPGTYGISGKVNRGTVSFGVVDAGATYTGSVSGKSMSGRYQTAVGGGSWSARKTS